MYVVPCHPVATVPVAGDRGLFPVHRIYCVGRNYAEHAREMGAAVDRETPTFFMKPPDAVWTSAEALPYPTATANLHHEVELVVALGSGGRDIPADRAHTRIYGYAVGLDLTRRDLQAAAKARGNPWDVSKGFDASAPISAIEPFASFDWPLAGRLTLRVNDALRQDADVSTMIFGIAEIIAELSRLFELKAGDLIYTGTPAGVGPLLPGDRWEATFASRLFLRGAISPRRTDAPGSA